MLIQMLQGSVLGRPHWRPGSRALVYDAKGDAYPTLGQLGIQDRVHILNPFDSRCTAWDISRDVQSPAVARQIAAILIPMSAKTGGAEEFFVQASRELLTAVFLGLIDRGRPWRLSDVLRIVLDPARLLRFLTNTELFIAQRVRKLYLDADRRTLSGILATLGTKLGIYEPIAALWEATERQHRRTISVQAWRNSESVLLLGNDETMRESLDAINRALFQRVTEEVLNLPEQNRALRERAENATWIFLDEVREAGRLDGLRRLLNKGRSKGACVVLGCQDVEGMRAVYGREEANEILGQCNHVTVLNLVGPDTLDWASRVFGQDYYNVSTSNDPQGPPHGASTSTREELRSPVTTRKLLTMKRISPQHGLSGYYRSPMLLEAKPFTELRMKRRMAPWEDDPEEHSWERAIRTYLPESFPARLSEEDRQPLVWDDKPFEERPPADQYLQNWTTDEEDAVLGPPLPAEGVADPPPAVPSRRSDALWQIVGE